MSDAACIAEAHTSKRRRYFEHGFLCKSRCHSHLESIRSGEHLGGTQIDPIRHPLVHKRLAHGRLLTHPFSQGVCPAFGGQRIIGDMVCPSPSAQRGDARPHHRRQTDQRQIERAKNERLHRMAIFMNDKLPGRLRWYKDERSQREALLFFPRCNVGRAVSCAFAPSICAEHHKSRQRLRQTPDRLKHQQQTHG